MAGASLSSPNSTQPSTAQPSKWKGVLQDASYYAAGALVHHPSESTKHYSILRHSHGLVYYKGSSTNVAMTIFADQPLPAGRSFWLQSKGWSGKSGMNIASSLGFKGNWVEVTPTQEATADQLNQADERAWQRDIRKFLKHSKHPVCETVVFRIQSTTADGYYRVVMRDGSKVLCPSPVFRLASTSASPSSMRGASLSTLPVEAGVKVLSLATSMTIGDYTEPGKEAATEQVTTSAGAVVPEEYWGQMQLVGETAYGASGAEDRVGAIGNAYDESREAAFQRAIADADEEPAAPFPLRLQGKIVQGTGASASRFGIPTANLAVRDADLLRFDGVYYGWCRTDKEKWRKAVASVYVLGEVTRVAPRKSLRVHVIDSTSVTGSMEVLLMGYLRPWKAPGSDEASLTLHMEDLLADIERTRLCLDRGGGWTAKAALESLIQTQGVTQRYVKARSTVQNRLDKVPLHLAGIRTGVMEQREQLTDRGGIYVRRG